jgi:DNA-binding NarL/FixJ family response regulator
MGSTTTPEGIPARPTPHLTGSPHVSLAKGRSDDTSLMHSMQRQSPRSIRIVIADDETIFRESLCMLLETKQRFEIVGSCAETETVLELIRKATPDIVLLDSSIFQHEGTDVLGEIKNSGVNVKVIVLCQSVTQADTVRALKAGARGIVEKNDRTSSLIESIHKVMQGEYWLGKGALDMVVEALCSSGEGGQDQKNKYGLTPRETQIIAAVLEGYSNPEIAAHLSLSEQTVKHHLSHVFDKLGVYSRVELALFAVNHRINAH